MRLIEFCDLGDAREQLVQQIGAVEMISEHIVRVTYVVRVPGHNEHAAVQHLLWDIADFRRSLDAASRFGSILDRPQNVARSAGAHGTH